MRKKISRLFLFKKSVPFLTVFSLCEIIHKSNQWGQNWFFFVSNSFNLMIVIRVCNTWTAFMFSSYIIACGEILWIDKVCKKNLIWLSTFSWMFNSTLFSVFKLITLVRLIDQTDVNFALSDKIWHLTRLFIVVLSILWKTLTPKDQRKKHLWP